MDESMDRFVAALDAHLTLIEKQIERLVRKASSLPVDQQQDYWDIAQELQKEARLTREQIRRKRERSKSQLESRPLRVFRLAGEQKTGGSDHPGKNALGWFRPGGKTKYNPGLPGSRIRNSGSNATLKEDSMRTKILLGLIFTIAIPAWLTDKLQPLNVKTGLWQVTATGTANGLPPIPPDLQAQMAQMTPEQRAKMEAMIKSRFGGTPQTATYKTCVTAKDLNSNPWANGSDEKCTWTVLKSTASDMEVRGTSCDAGKNQGMKTDVDIKFHVIDPENVKASMQGNSTGNGRTVNISGTYTGKWLGTSCPADTK